jgi:galactokinase
MSNFSGIISRAPGRVCLFGEHQDYLGLPVIAAAIERYIDLVGRRNGTDMIRIFMPDINETREFHISEPFDNLQPRDYFGSTLRVLKRYGCFPGEGLEIEVHGNIPVNAGASSSSALTVAWAQLLLHLFGADRPVNVNLLAQIAYEAEVKEHGEPGGMMDHFSISSGGVVHIETENRYVAHPLTENLEGLILGDSKLPKKTLQVLAETRQGVHKAVNILKNDLPGFQLKHAATEQLGEYLPLIPENIAPFFRAAVQNHSYTQRALREFRTAEPDIEQIGDLMNQHHAVLQNLLKITVPKIDKMIEAVLQAGALGAKINGSGGGGTIVILAPDRENQVMQALREVDAEGYPVKVDPGARIIMEEKKAR